MRAFRRFLIGRHLDHALPLIDHCAAATDRSLLETAAE